MLTVFRWSGRFGNNIFQLLHALWIAECCGIPVISFPVHPLLTRQRLSVRLQVPVVTGTWSGVYYFRERDATLPDPDCLQRVTVADYRRLGQQYLLPLLVRTELPLGQGDLYVHLRGGDIFASWIHPSYVQPPLAYYRSLMDQSKALRVLLVAEPGDNPVLPFLQRDGRVTVQQGTLVQDIWTLIHARQVVAGYGTFALALFYLSPYTQHLWLPQYITGLAVAPAPHPSITLVPLPQYIPEDSWRNTPTQRQEMVEWRPPVRFRKAR
jgi:hypothetical protein